MEVVDPRYYHGFCLRGEGRDRIHKIMESICYFLIWKSLANFVISSKCDKNGLRIVWRLSKHRKSGLISAKQHCELLGQYIEKFISPFIGEEFLIKPRIVQMHVQDLMLIAKVPSLPHNFRVEHFEELADVEKYPSDLSLFPLSSIGLVKTYPLIDILEMADATRIPKRLSNTFGPTITIELKPKQGFLQHHPGINIQFCNNCILQIEKSKSGAFHSMYDFCPLDLFSGDLDRMSQAIESLIADPHRNLRVFLDGTPVHDEESVLNRSALETLLFPNSQIQLNLLIKALCCVLVGVHDDCEPFYMRENSILATLLKAQKIDTIGIVRARKIYERLPPDVQNQLLDKKNLLNRSNTNFLIADDPRSLLERYFVAATIKDCSLMLSFRLVDSRLSTDDPCSMYMVRVRPTPDDQPICFTFSIRVVDLDPKSPRNLLNAYQRFIAGVNTIVSGSPGFHKPCQL